MKKKSWLFRLALLMLFISAGILLLSYSQEQKARQLYLALQDQINSDMPFSSSSRPLVSSSQKSVNSPTQSALPTSNTDQADDSSEQFMIHPADVQQFLSVEDESARQFLQVLESLQADNADVVGWIRIPGTNIDYPVVLGDDNRYYLERDITRTRSKYGSIFMDYRNSARLEQKNTILYGHHMRDKTMFAALMHYKQQAFFKQNAIIEYYTVERQTKWLIFSAYVTDVSFYYIETNFPTDESFQKFLDKINMRSKYFRPVELTADDQVLTLSTCTYEFENARFVVHAVLLDPDLKGYERLFITQQVRAGKFTVDR